MPTTYFVALPFCRDPEGLPVAGEPKEARDGQQARRFAERLAAASDACGAIVFSRTGEPESGDWADAVILHRIGDTGDLT